MLSTGEKAPEIELVAANGKTVRLSDFSGKKLVVFFYPKDDSPGCTREACQFRDAYDDFTEAGAEVIGISSDSTASHEAFGKKHGLPMTLLSDPKGSARKSFGVGSTLGILPGRATFVIDREGVVRNAFSSQLRLGKHVEDALAVVKSLS